ncbi:MAG: transporter [Bacteroidia bacterium]|nr:transporter [Bacteroidia bacterium]
MNLKVIYSILFLCYSLFAKAQFNKQWLVSGGFQFSYYEQSTTTLYTNGRIISNKGYQTNIGLSAELGYFVLKNISLSYQFTYLLYDDNNSNHNIYKFYRNGISLNKLFPLNQDLFLNVGATPFYTKRSFKESVLSPIDDVLHGCIFDAGVSFLIDKNSVLSMNLYKQLDNQPEDVFNNNKSGMYIKYRYIFKNKTK